MRDAEEGKGGGWGTVGITPPRRWRYYHLLVISFASASTKVCGEGE